MDCHFHQQILRLEKTIRQCDTLNKGEGNLPKKSVVNISQIFTVKKSDLSEKIGTLTGDRIHQILNGIRLLTEPREVD
jgi:mRNA interferase MazF